MKQYIVRETKHDTGEVFYDAYKFKDNEGFFIVEANNVDEAKDIARDTSEGREYE